MRLYYHPFSSNARRAVMTALQLNVPLDLVRVNLATGEQRAPDYLKLNPNGKVPVLEDDDFVLWESHAIMVYLAEKTPGQTLYPSDIRARADVNRWLFWCAYHFTPAVGILNWERMVKRLIGAGDPDPAAIARGEAQVRDTARVLDAHLAEREWLAGTTLSLADLAIASPLMSTESAQLPVQDSPNLMRWFRRIQELEVWRKTNPAP